MRAPVIKRVRMEAREASRLNRLAEELGVTEGDVMLEALRLMDELRKQNQELGIAGAARLPAARLARDNEFDL